NRRCRSSASFGARWQRGPASGCGARPACHSRRYASCSMPCLVKPRTTTGQRMACKHTPWPWCSSPTKGHERMYATSSPVPQQEPLFPSPDGRPSRPYRVPVYRVTLVRERRLPHAQPQLRSSREAAVLFRQHLGEVDREHFMVAMLDQKHKVIGINTVSIGSLTASVVHPREGMCAVGAVVVSRHTT